jgi:release factor glutamine methyltransferase
VYFEHGYNQGASIRQLLNEAGLTQVRTIQDLSGNDRVSTGILK